MPATIIPFRPRAPKPAKPARPPRDIYDLMLQDFVDEIRALKEAREQERNARPLPGKGGLVQMVKERAKAKARARAKAKAPKE